MSRASSTYAAAPGHRGDAAFAWVSEHQRRVVWLAVVALGALVALWVLEYHGGGLPGQQAVYDHFKARMMQLPPDEVAIWQLSRAFGSPPVALSTLGVLLLILERRLGLRAAIFLGACSAVVVVDAGLNALLGPTPEIGGVDSLLEANFPSGHVAYATGMFGGAATLALMWGQRDIAAVAAAVPAFGGPAQVVYAAHLVSDVLAGYALGIAWVCLMLLAFFWWGGDTARVEREP